MNAKQRILTYLLLAIFSLTLFVVPWRVSDSLGGHYELSACWHPVSFDEGGAIRPMLLYIEWVILAVTYFILILCLRSKKSRPQNRLQLRSSKKHFAP
jgi:hypothetical protein